MICIENLILVIKKTGSFFRIESFIDRGGIFMACLERMEPVRLLY